SRRSGGSSVTFWSWRTGGTGFALRSCRSLRTGRAVRSIDSISSRIAFRTLYSSCSRMKQSYAEVVISGKYRVLVVGGCLPERLIRDYSIRGLSIRFEEPYDDRVGDRRRKVDA